MSLDLDKRQRAMLQEMGVRVWWPAPVAAAEPAAVVQSAPRQAGTAAMTAPVAAAMAPAQPDQTGSAPAAQEIAEMDWSALARTIAACRACTLCEGRRSPVFAAAAACRADWLVLGEPPDDNEERMGSPFSGQAGQLLDNMLRAVAVRRTGADDGTSATAGLAYLSNAVKCRPASARNPEPQDLASCEAYLRREVALVQPKVILALGRFAAQALLLGSVPEVASIPLGKLRGQVYRYQGVAVIVSYHPAYLLRTPQDKARSWLDLCQAAQLVARHGE